MINSEDKPAEEWVLWHSSFVQTDLGSFSVQHSEVESLQPYPARVTYTVESGRLVNWAADYTRQGESAGVHRGPVVRDPNVRIEIIKIDRNVWEGRVYFRNAPKIRREV